MTVYCTICGAANPIENRFCSVCAYKLMTKLEDPDDTIEICPSCGQANPLENRFCFSCGYSFRGEPASESSDIPYDESNSLKRAKRLSGIRKWLKHHASIDHDERAYKRVDHSHEKREKLERYRRLNAFVRPYQILFAGSSLMEQFPIGELLLDLKLPYTIYNRGIGGYTTQELLDSMDICIYDLLPDTIYLNIGTNDMNGPDYSESKLIGRYRSIIEGIYAHLPDVKLYLLAYYPVNPSAATDPGMQEVLTWRTNDRIFSANAAVEKLAGETGASFIDLNAGITDRNGELKAEYTIDGMHMYADGYMQVLKAMLLYLPQ